MTGPSADVVAAARLLSFAARPKERPGRNSDYAELVRRYLDDAAFAEVCSSVAAGLAIDIHVVDAEVGLIASAASDSNLRPPLDYLVKQTAPEVRRALPGVVLLAVAHVAFPVPSHLNDPTRVAYVTVDSVVATISRLAERAAEAAGDPDADHPEMAEVWRAWEALREARHSAQRSSAGDRRGLVRKVCGFLERHGHLSAGERDTWRATPRFRLAVRSVVEDSDYYADLVGLLDADGPGDPP